MEDFLAAEEFVVKKKGAVMLMSTFRDLFERYRHKYNMGKAKRWGEDVYRTPFNERGISEYKAANYTDRDGIVHPNAHLVCNLIEVE